MCVKILFKNPLPIVGCWTYPGPTNYFNKLDSTLHDDAFTIAKKFLGRLL